MARTLRLAILFADITGSTQLYDSLGNEKAHGLVSGCLDELQSIVTRCRGRVVKTTGDGVFCVFGRVDHCIEAACDLQRRILEETRKPADIALRVGVHAGEVILEDADCYGDAVNVCHRALEIASSGQIIATKIIADNAQRAGVGVRYLTRAHLKGKRDKAPIYEVMWWDEAKADATAIFRDSQLDITTSEAMELEFRDIVHVINRDNIDITIGRRSLNDLSIDNQFISKQHAVISVNNNKFVLRDFSTNGTFVYLEDERKTFLHRDEIALQGHGRISFGRDYYDSPDVVRFRIVSALDG